VADPIELPGAKGSWGLVGRVVLYSLLIIFACYYLLPLFVMLATSVKTMDEIRGASLLSLPRDITFAAWAEVWSQASIGVKDGGLKPYFVNSIAMVVPSVILSSFIGALNGYALTKWRFPGANIVFAALLLGCFIPFQVVILPMSLTLGMFGLSNSVIGLVAVHVIYGLSFTTLFFRNYYVSLPDDLIKAATIDGAGFFTIFWRIILPLSPPIIVVTIIWQFTQIWNDFLFGVSFTSGDGSPVTVALNNLVNTTTGEKKYNNDMAAAIIAALPTLLVYVLAGKYFVRGLTAGSVKG
jgi:glucose/mannose transport system permease protein